MKIIQNWVKDPSSIQASLKNIAQVDKQAHLLDTTIDAFDFIYAQDLVYNPSSVKDRRHQILVERAMIDYVSTTLKISRPQEELPENGHRSQRLGFHSGYRKNAGTNLQASMRFALHDLLDPLPGQPTFSEIHFAGFRLHLQQKEYSQKNKMELDYLDFFRVSSFDPIGSWQKNISWTARLGLRTVRDLCDACLAGHLELGGGASISPWNNESFISFLTKFEVDGAGNLDGYLRTLMGPEIWWRWIPHRKISSLVKIGYKWSHLMETPRFDSPVFTPSGEFRYHFHPLWSLSLKAEWENEDHASQIGFYRFF